MYLIFKNKNFLSILFILFFILWGWFFVNELLNKSQDNIKVLSNYGNSIIWNNQLDITNIWDFILDIWWTKIQWSSLSDFISKIQKLSDGNISKKITIKIIDENGQIIKIYDNYTYWDFSYSLNIKWISEKIRFAIINGNTSLSLPLWEFIFFDNKKFNEIFKKIKSEFNETHLWQLYYDVDNQSIKVNNNKIYLTQITNTQAKIEDVTQKIELEWSELTLTLEKKENDLFKKADSLNEQISKLKQIWVNLKLNDLKWFNTNVINNYFKNNKNKLISINLKEWLSINLKNWFLSDYINFDQQAEKIIFKEEQFNKDFWFLTNLKIIDKDFQIIENPSLYQIKEWFLDENIPLESDFRLVYANNYIDFDYIALLKEIKLIFNALDTKTDTNIIYTDIIKSKPLDKEHKVKLSIKDQQLLSKSAIQLNFKKWLYKNNNFLWEIFINYNNYPFKISNNESGCYIQDNINLYCWNSLYVWKLWFDKWKILIKDVSNLFWYYHNPDDTSITKFWWNFILNWNTISLTNWDQYFNNVKIENKINSIIYDFNLNQTPKILYTHIKSTEVVNDKLLLYYKPWDKTYFLVKDNWSDYLFYLFDLEIYE